jgi:hypothetical protein
MFLRKKKPKMPLQQAIELVNQAVTLAETYSRDNNHALSNNDIQELNTLLAALWSNHCTLEYVIKTLRR